MAGAAADKMGEEFNYSPQTMPAGMFPTVFITHRDVDAGLVYLVTKTIGDNKAALVAAHKGLAKFDPASAWKPELVGLPLHPGAEKYYREKGWMK